MTKKRKKAISYLGLKPLSASRQTGKTENKIFSLVKSLIDKLSEREIQAVHTQTPSILHQYIFVHSEVEEDDEEGRKNNI